MRLIGDYIRSSVIKKNNNKLDKSMKQLASGKRLNSSADNAAGLAISEKMRAQIRGLERASKNCEEAVSFVQTADSIMGSVTESIQRMKELAVQSANGINTDEDRRALEEEFKNIQTSIDSMIEYADFNGLNIFEKHEDTYATIMGNNTFKPEGYLNVISGLSDNLTIGINGEELNIVVPEGRYTTQELADKIDDVLFDKYGDKGVNIEFTKEGTFNINYENGKDIDFITGGLSYLIYNTNRGNKEGLVIGTTIFNEGEKLIIKGGQNDTLSFYLGSKDEPITIVLDDGRYSRNEVIDLINKKLDDIGKSTIRATAYGEKFISLADENDIITGLKGNMFKIDYGDHIYSSVFYDNTNYGFIEKDTASIRSGRSYGDTRDGKVSIQSGVNDSLSFTLNGKEKYNVVLSAGKYTASEMATELNRLFEEKSIGMTASSRVNRLIVSSNLTGTKSEISFDTSTQVNKDTYESLFSKVEKVDELSVQERKYVEASLKGYKTIYSSDKIEINNENNKIKLDIKEKNGSESVEMKLTNGIYDKDSLMSELKKALAEKTDKISVDYNSSCISFKSLDKNISKISFEEISSNAYQTLFRSRYVYPMDSIEQGKSVTIQGSTTVVDTPAITVGDEQIRFPVTFNNKNNELNYSINGVYKNIKISEKIYNSKEDLLKELNSKMNSSDGSGVIVSFDSSRKLIFTSERTGDKARLSNFSGTALEIINGYYDYKEEAKEAGNTVSKIDGKLGVFDTVDINSTNNVLNFQYKKSDAEAFKSYSIKLNEGTYNKNQLESELNRALNEQGLADYINATVSYNDQYSSSNTSNGINFDSKKEEGEFNNKDTISGSFLNVINKREVYHNPEDYNTRKDVLDGKVKGFYKEDQTAFIVGREEISGRQLEILSGVNDSLIFDFEMPDKNGYSKNYELKIKIEGGSYDTSSLINEIQSKLNKELVSQGLKENMINAQIGGVKTGMAHDDKMFVLKYNGDEESSNEGNYLIHGVRGTAAYTIFYKKEDDLRPASVVGTRMFADEIEVTGDETDLSLNIDGIKYDISLKAGKYNEETFIDMINEGLKEATSKEDGAIIPMPLVASMEKGNLKLSYNHLGIHTIEKIQGPAKELFFKEESRDENIDLKIMAGANNGQSLSIDKIALSTSLLKINTATIEKLANADKLNKRLDYALQRLNLSRGEYGAVQNRLEHIMNIDDNSGENLQSAESKIRDTDMAKAMVSFSKLNILSQVTMSLLTQSKGLDNQFVQNILK